MLLLITHSEERVSELMGYITLHETDEDKSHWMIDKSWIFTIPRRQVSVEDVHMRCLRTCMVSIDTNATFTTRV